MSDGNGKQMVVPQGPKQVVVPTAPPSGGGAEVVRRDFSGEQTMQTGETASTAMAAKATAAVQARYVMAMKNPRDLMEVRVRLLKDCARPGFADAAIYHKPVGKGIEGPSIRLAEAAARAMTNITSSVTTIYDDARKRIINVSATDLESNLTFDKDVTVSKTMERSQLKPGQVPLKQRINSQGNTTFLVEAETDDDILNSENALASKALRVCLLRLVPGDILEEAMREAYNTIEKKITEDPDKALKSICDWFDMQLRITPAQLAKYLGHPVAETTVAEIAMLKKVFSAIKDGETSWVEVMDNRGGSAATEPTPPKGKASVDDLAAQAKAKREGADKPADQPAQAATTKPSGPAQQTLAKPASKPAPPPPDEDQGDVPEWMKTPNGQPPEDK